MRNGSGTYSLPAGNPVVTGTTISSATQNTTLTDIATALTQSVAANGETPITANIPMAGFKITGMGAASSRTDSAALGNVQDGSVNWIAAGGTADAITATYSPAITALVDGQSCKFRASAANTTTTPTFSPNGLTARTITRQGGGTLVAGNIYGANTEVELRYNLANTRWEIVNPNLIGTAPAFIGTNFTGTAASLNIGGNAATATTVTTATNQLNGTVQASSFGIQGGQGFGGLVTQSGIITSAVTLNKISGAITTVSNAFVAGSTYGFILNNSLIGIYDVIAVSATASGGQTVVVSAGYGATGTSFIQIYSGTTATFTITIAFVVIHNAFN